MSREFLLRAKRKDNNAWLVSCSIDQWDDGRVFLFDETSGDMEEVIPETVGQFTGYTGNTDDGTANLFKGDIVRYRDNTFEIGYERGAFILVRRGGDMMSIFENAWNDHVYPLIQLQWDCMDISEPHLDVEIIGNVYGNPELLEGNL